MSDITVRQLEYFLAVVDYGSISASSRALHISQAAVSMAVQQLEGSLNAQLLSRSPARRATTTPAGDSLIPYARRVIAAINDAAAVVQDDQSRMRGTLRLEVTASISPHVVPPLITHFHKHHPQVTIEVAESRPAELYDFIRRGNADLGLLYQRQTHPGVTTTTVHEIHPYVVVAANHPLADRSSIYLADLIDEPLIPVDIPPSMERITEAIAGVGLTPKIQWPSSNYETVRSMVAHGLGWSYFNLIPSSYVAYDGREVRYIPVADTTPHNAIVAVEQPDPTRSAKVETAIEFLRQHLEMHN
ncbi:MAG: LysR family transcriptional regulator [Micrococcaceae bacterium]|nr:LysR family transcriptional regulator [Micrococcaceae bacterium]